MAGRLVARTAIAHRVPVKATTSPPARPLGALGTGTLYVFPPTLDRTCWKVLLARPVIADWDFGVAK